MRGFSHQWAGNLQARGSGAVAAPGALSAFVPDRGTKWHAAAGCLAGSGQRRRAIAPREWFSAGAIKKMVYAGGGAAPGRTRGSGCGAQAACGERCARIAVFAGAGAMARIAAAYGPTQAASA